MKSGPRILVRVLACLGLVISVWLLSQKLVGNINSIAGCGEGSSCANVLGSRWSQVFLIPVSALSTMFYTVLLVLTFRPRMMPLFITGVLLIGAALWFTGLQAFVLKSFCPWCLATHGIGLLCGLTILFGLDPRQAKPGLPMVMAGLMLGILALGQVLGPQPPTYLLTDEEGAVGDLPAEPTESDPADRHVTFLGGKRSYLLRELPHIGALDAPHVMVKYFDYTCGSCRDMHGDLKALQAAHPGEITVIMLPSPLNRACNPSMRSEMEDHPDACEIARLALAAWRAKPDAFPQIHDELFVVRGLGSEGARNLILKHVSEAELEIAMADPWVERQLKSNVSDFALFVTQTGKMPKLLIRDGKMMHGLSASTEVFLEVVGGELGF